MTNLMNEKQVSRIKDFIQKQFTVGRNQIRYDFKRSFPKNGVTKNEVKSPLEDFKIFDRQMEILP